MQKKQIKICGLTKQQHFELCIENKADYIGCVFYKNSSRFIDIKNASNILQNIKLNNFTKIVGVVVNPTLNELKEIFDIGISTLQIHFKLQDFNTANISLLNSIKKLNKDINIILGFNITDIANNSNIIQEFNLYSDFLLIDSEIKTNNKNLYGGSGEAFEWSLLNQDLFYKIYSKLNKTLFNKNFFIAGGININNIENAFNYSNFVDLSSGVEITKGVKDSQKIQELLNFVNQFCK